MRKILLLLVLIAFAVVLIESTEITEEQISQHEKTDSQCSRYPTITGVHLLLASNTTIQNQNELGRCSPGNSVWLEPGYYNLTAILTIGKKNLTINGTGPDSTFVYRTTGCFAANITCDLILSNMSIQSTTSYAVRKQSLGNVSIRDCRIVSNTSYCLYYTSNGDLDIHNSEIRSTTSYGIWRTGNGHSTTISGNIITAGRGIWHNSGVGNVTFINSNVTVGGRGIYFGGIGNISILGTYVMSYGEHAVNHQGVGNITVIDSRVINTLRYAIYKNYIGNIYIRNSTVQSSSSSVQREGYGIGTSAMGDITIINSTIRSNSTAVYKHPVNPGSNNVCHISISNSSLSGSSGVYHGNYGYLNITNVAINTTYGTGIRYGNYYGGFTYPDMLIINNVTISSTGSGTVLDVSARFLYSNLSISSNKGLLIYYSGLDEIDLYNGTGLTAYGCSGVMIYTSANTTFHDFNFISSNYPGSFYSTSIVRFYNCTYTGDSFFRIYSSGPIYFYSCVFDGDNPYGSIEHASTAPLTFIDCIIDCTLAINCTQNDKILNFINTTCTGVVARSYSYSSVTNTIVTGLQENNLILDIPHTYEYIYPEGYFLVPNLGTFTWFGSYATILPDTPGIVVNTKSTNQSFNSTTNSLGVAVFTDLPITYTQAGNTTYTWNLTIPSTWNVSNVSVSARSNPITFYSTPNNILWYSIPSDFIVSATDIYHPPIPTPVLNLSYGPNFLTSLNTDLQASTILANNPESKWVATWDHETTRFIYYYYDGRGVDFTIPYGEAYFLFMSIPSQFNSYLTGNTQNTTITSGITAIGNTLNETTNSTTLFDLNPSIQWIATYHWGQYIYTYRDSPTIATYQPYTSFWVFSTYEAILNLK